MRASQSFLVVALVSLVSAILVLYSLDPATPVYPILLDSRVSAAWTLIATGIVSGIASLLVEGFDLAGDDRPRGTR